MHLRRIVKWRDAVHGVARMYEVSVLLYIFQVQFGHAGALASAEMEKSVIKNAALKAAGAMVPNSFDEFGDAIRSTYTTLAEQGILVLVSEPAIPKIPVDYKWAKLF